MIRIAWALAFTLFVMAPTLTHFSTRKFGPNISGVGSDSYGFMYHVWIQSQPADGRIRSDSRDLLTSYPSGQAMAQPTSINGWLTFRFGRLGLAPAAAYNLTIAISFFLTFLLTQMLAQRIGISYPLSLLAAYLVAMSPYQVLQSVDHIDLASSWVLLLYIYWGYRLLVGREALASVGMILASGLSVWSHPYYFVMTLILGAAAIPFALYFWWTKRLKIAAKDWGVIGSAGLAGALLVLGWRHVFHSVAGDAGVTLGVRRIDDLYTYSTKIWDFILPAHYSWLFSGLSNPIKYPQTAAIGTNLVENTLYPGFVAWVAVITLVVWWALQRKTFKKWNAKLLFVAAMAAVSILFSISPTFSVFGFELPTPTLGLHYIINEFRTMSRFGFVAVVAMVLAASVLIDAVFDRWKLKPLRRAVAAILLAVFSIFDIGILHASFYSDTSDVPAVYRDFKENSNDQSVLFELPYTWGYISWYWQSYHQRRNFGVFDPNTQNHRDIIAAQRTSINEWLLFARSKGITHLIVHSQEPLNIPGAKVFQNSLKETQIFFLFANYSYLLDVSRY